MKSDRQTMNELVVELKQVQAENAALRNLRDALKRVVEELEARDANFLSNLHAALDETATLHDAAAWQQRIRDILDAAKAAKETY